MTSLCGLSFFLLGTIIIIIIKAFLNILKQVDLHPDIKRFDPGVNIILLQWLKLTSNRISKQITTMQKTKGSKGISLWLVFIFFISCTSNNKTLEIEGTVRADRDFTDEVIYLVPMEGKTSVTDSAVIADNFFRIKANVDTASIYVIRAKNPLLGYFLQPLLVVMEPGELEVRLDSVSFAKGTPLNETLQKWKDNKIETDNKIHQIRKQIRNADDELKETLEKQLTQQKETYLDYNFNFVKENKDNPLGKFVYKMTKSQFTPEQLRKLDNIE